MTIYHHTGRSKCNFPNVLTNILEWSLGSPRRDTELTDETPKFSLSHLGKAIRQAPSLAENPS